VSLPTSACRDVFLPAVLIAGLLSLVPVQQGYAGPITKRLHGDGGDYTVACDTGPFAADYVAETASGVPLTSAYAVARDADKGLVRLMAEGGRRVKEYQIPHGLIRALIRVKRDADIPDRADLVFTVRGLILVETSTANAGIFTDSDVYQLPIGRDGKVQDGSLRGVPDDLREMLRLGLSAYDIRAARCLM